MMTVMAIMVILATIAGSMFTNHVQNRNLQEAAAAVMSDIKLAKQKSTAEKTSMTIAIHQENNSYNLMGAEKNFSRYGSGILIMKNNFPKNMINFQARGTCSPGGSLWLINSIGSSIKITVSPMGRIRSVETYQ